MAAVTPESSEPQPPRSLLAGAVETHAAIREGAPYVPPDDGGVTDKASQPPVMPPRSPRARRRRRDAE